MIAEKVSNAYFKLVDECKQMDDENKKDKPLTEDYIEEVCTVLTRRIRDLRSALTEARKK